MSIEIGDATLRRAYDALLHTRAAGGHPAGRAPAVPVENIVALVEGRGDESERLATLDAVMADEASLREFELLRSLAANRQTQSTTRRTWGVSATIATLAAAAVLFAVIPTVRRPQPHEGAEPVRDAVRSAVLLAPPTEATVEQSRTFRWRAVPDARVYALEILTAAGTPVFTTRVADTMLTLPPDVRLTPGVEHRWWILTEFADGTQLRAPLRRLIVRETR